MFKYGDTAHQETKLEVETTIDSPLKLSETGMNFVLFFIGAVDLTPVRVQTEGFIDIAM